MTPLRSVSHTCFLVLLMFAAAAGPAFGAARRGVTPRDYYAFRNVSDARISPDGKLIAYTVTTADEKRNRRFTEIWAVPADGSRPGFQLTTGESSRSPRWSPDGRAVAFLSIRPAIR